MLLTLAVVAEPTARRRHGSYRPYLTLVLLMVFLVVKTELFAIIVSSHTSVAGVCPASSPAVRPGTSVRQ